MFYFILKVQKKLLKRDWKKERVIESSQKDSYEPCEEIHKQKKEKNRKENERENGRKRETAQIPSKVKMEMPSGKK